MKRSLLLAVVVVAWVAQMAIAEDKIVPRMPHGLKTIDFSAKWWGELEDKAKLSGSVSNAVTYESMERVFILRCNMHVPVPSEQFLESVIRLSIPAERTFDRGPVPDGVLQKPERPYLTVLFQTKKGDIGLLTVYSQMTIVELNNRFGMIVKTEVR